MLTAKVLEEFRLFKSERSDDCDFFLFLAEKRLERRFGINLTTLCQPVAIISAAQTVLLACLKLITELENQCLKFRFNTRTLLEQVLVDRRSLSILLSPPPESKLSKSKDHRCLYDSLPSFLDARPPIQFVCKSV